MEEDNLERALEDLGNSQSESPPQEQSNPSQDQSQNQEQEQSPTNTNQQPKQQMSEKEQIVFHKGALNTLMGERSELIKMLQNVEAIIQQHIKRLKELGVEIKQNSNPPSE